MRTVSRLVMPAVAAGILLAAGSASAQRTINLPRADRALPGKAAPAFTIGAVEGENWELLSGVRSVAFDHADNLYILDAGNFRVLVFDRAGNFLRQIGRKGDGPGELSAPTTIAITRDAKLAVADLGRRGYSLFERDGTFIRTVTAPEDRGFVFGGTEQNGIAADPNGWLIARSMPRLQLRGDGPSGPRGGSPVYRQPLEDNATTTTLHEFPVPEPRVQTSGGGERRVMAVMSPAAFSPPSLWGVLPNGGIAFVQDDDYRIELTDAQGNAAAVVQRPITPRAVSDRDKQQAREEVEQQAASGQGGISVTNVNGVASFSTSGGGNRDMSGAAREMLRTRLENMEFAETVPVISGLRTDVTGRIWVQREHRDLFTPGPIDLLTATGEYLGTITGEALPNAVSRHGSAAYIVRDEEYDIEQVVVKRLPPQWAAPAPRG